MCSHNLGMATNLKHDRLIRHCRVIDNEICFNSKEVYNLLVHTRCGLMALQTDVNPADSFVCHHADCAI